MQSRNNIGTYNTEAEARAFVRSAMAHQGRGYIENLAMGWVDNADEARSEEIATGEALAERAENQRVA